MSIFDDNEALTEAVKASVKNSGALANLQNVSHDDVPKSDSESLSTLKEQAQTAMDNIQQLLDSGKLDDGSSQKLSSALAKLRTALAKGAVSREALNTALSEATSAIGSADSSGKNATATPLTVAQMWQKVDADNKDIDDDFDKMRKANIAFNENLWNRHKQLMEELQERPHDIKKQKELDAVDDAMLMQAESQLDKHPDAKPSFNDAKKKSKDRHQIVDKDLIVTTKGKESVAANTDADWEMDSAQRKQAINNELSMNDVMPQSVGHKLKPVGKQHS